VSVDERDDIAVLKKYIPLFDEKFTGLTRDKETIGNVARAYGAFYPESGGMNHRGHREHRG
jgi:cytochrome oxidase Cu insertion factor (SCO1/SenC/PrrC family)